MVRLLDETARAAIPVEVTRAPTSSDQAVLVMFWNLDRPEPNDPVRVTVKSGLVAGEPIEYRSYFARQGSAEVQSCVGLLPNLNRGRQHFGLSTAGDSVFASLQGAALVPERISWKGGDEQQLVVLRDGTQIRGFTFSLRIGNRILNVRVVGVDFTSVETVVALLTPHAAALATR